MDIRLWHLAWPLPLPLPWHVPLPSALPLALRGPPSVQAAHILRDHPHQTLVLCRHRNRQGYPVPGVREQGVEDQVAPGDHVHLRVRVAEVRRLVVGPAVRGGCPLLGAAGPLGIRWRALAAVLVLPACAALMNTPSSAPCNQVIGCASAATRTASSRSTSTRWSRRSGRRRARASTASRCGRCSSSSTTTSCSSASGRAGGRSSTARATTSRRSTHSCPRAPCASARRWLAWERRASGRCRRGAGDRQRGYI